MTKLTVNGILINALQFSREFISIDFNEAERILTTIPNHNLTIDIRHYNSTLNLDNLEEFRNREHATYILRNTKIKGVDEASDIKEEAYDACLMAIKAQLERIGGFVNFADSDIIEMVGNSRAGIKSIRSLALNEDGEILVPHTSGRTRKLLSMTINEEIKIDEVVDVLEALEKIKALKIEVV